MSLEGNGWQTVSKKGSKKKGPLRMLSVPCEERAGTNVKGFHHNKDDYQLVVLKIQQLKAELRTSDLWDSFQNTIQHCFKKCLVQTKQNPQCFTETKFISAGDIQEPEPVIKQVAQNHSEKQESYFREGREDWPTSCVCYGIGQFSSCVISRYQLAFLLLMLEKLQILKCQCQVFDPLFSSSEIEVLKALGLSVILENEEGKHSVVCATVFYMIHCGKALYNNLLWKNWSVNNLSKLVIIGNSFQGFEERLPARILESNYAYISKVLKVTEETLFPHTAKYADIFNDTALHWFPLEKLKELQNDIWLVRDEPEYDKEEDVEIIRSERKPN